MTVLHTPYGAVRLRRRGQGQRLLIALHGFAQDGSAFDELVDADGHSGTLYAIDLPFHGETAWKRKDFRPGQLADIIDHILIRENRLRFEAIGHSMGARLWISLLPRYTGRINALYLIAPDGFYLPWGKLTEPLPATARKLAGRLVQDPDWLLQTAAWLYRRGWLDHFAIRYLNHHCAGPQRLQRMLHTWYSLAHFPLKRQRAVQLLRESNVPTLVLLGQQDRIVPTTRVQPYLEDLPNVLVQEEPGTHLSLLKQAAPYLKDGLIRYWQWLRMK
mgnify:CR=1 FL=1